MEAALFAEMISDKSVTDLKKLQYKYPHANIEEFVRLLNSSLYRSLPLTDFNGQQCVYMSNMSQVRTSTIKALMHRQGGEYKYGFKAMENEIISTLAIENIPASRDSVKRILNGYAPNDNSENFIYGIKKGLDFISEPNNRITEANIFALYQMAIGDFLDTDDKLLLNRYYRHDKVYIMGQALEHMGLPHQMLPEYISGLISFINEEDEMNDLTKAAVIHFYIGYLHPYFDGNGRMARLLHLWYLVQQGYSSILFISLSSHVNKNKAQYYNAFTLVEKNAKISGVLDVTPFLEYFIGCVYNHLESGAPPHRTVEQFSKQLDDGQITPKERDLWNFVLTAYGTAEFSTKQLERDFGNAAYATIRGFVMKLERLSLLNCKRYGSRVKYQIEL